MNLKITIQKRKKTHESKRNKHIEISYQIMCISPKNRRFLASAPSPTCSDHPQQPPSMSPRRLLWSGAAPQAITYLYIYIYMYIYIYIFIYICIYIYIYMDVMCQMLVEWDLTNKHGFVPSGKLTCSMGMLNSQMVFVTSVKHAINQQFGSGKHTTQKTTCDDSGYLGDD